MERLLEAYKIFTYLVDTSIDGQIEAFDGGLITNYTHLRNWTKQSHSVSALSFFKVGGKSLVLEQLLLIQPNTVL